MKRILIVGQKFSTLTKYLVDHNYEYIVLKDKARTKFPDKRFKRRVVCDFSTKESILAAVDTIQQSVDGVIATYENYILPTSWIAERLGLPGISPQSAMACTDKSIMRELFAKSPEQISPAFTVIKSEQTLYDFAKQHGFPLIIKPANLSKSLLVTHSNSIEELLQNYARTMNQIHDIYQKYAPSRSPKLLVEEFLEGRIYSVEAFTGADGKPHVLKNVVDYTHAREVGFDDNFLYSRHVPSHLSADEQAALRHCAALGVKALGITNSPAHVEVIMTPKGPRLVEIGARNGGYRERLHLIGNGIDITGAALALTLGQKPNIAATKNDPCTVLELFPKTPGVFSHIAHQQELEALPSLQYFSCKVKPGQFVGHAADGHIMSAVIILHSINREQFNKDLKYVNTHVAVTTV